MPRLWWEPKRYQLKTGKWVPQVHLYEEVPGGAEVTKILAPDGTEFDSEEEARTYSEGMARKWIKDKYL